MATDTNILLARPVFGQCQEVTTPAPDLSCEIYRVRASGPGGGGGCIFRCSQSNETRAKTTISEGSARYL